MQNIYLKSAEIVRRMKMNFPMHVTLNDPLSGEPMTISRGNILELLVVETHNLVLEGQTVAACYAEVARFKAAAELASAKAEAAYRKFKARAADELREQHKKKKAKAPTVNEIESYYRQHEEYDKWHDEPLRLKVVAGLFSDLQRAFDIKGKVVHDQMGAIRGHETVMRSSDEDGDPERMTAYADMAAEASALVGEDPPELPPELSGTKKTGGRKARTPS